MDIWLKFVPEGQINIIPEFVQTRTLRPPGDRPLVSLNKPLICYRLRNASLGLNELKRWSSWYSFADLAPLLQILQIVELGSYKILTTVWPQPKIDTHAVKLYQYSAVGTVKHQNHPRHDDVIKWKHFRSTDLSCGNSAGTGEFPTQRPVTRGFDVFFDLRPNKRLSKQSWSLWFGTHSPPHCDVTVMEDSGSGKQIAFMCSLFVTVKIL